jgi:hypothetical protein
MANLKAVDTTTVSAAVSEAVKFISSAVKKGEEITTGGYRAAAEILAPGLAMHHKTWYQHGIEPGVTDKGLLEVFKIYRQVSALLVDGGMPASTARSAIGLIRQYAMETEEPILAAEIASEKKAATETSRAARAEKRSFRERIEADVCPVIRMGESTADSDLDLADMGLLKALKLALKAAGIKWSKPE